MYSKLALSLFLLITALLVIGCSFFAGYFYHEQRVAPIIEERIVYVDRWHEPMVVETIRYEPLPDEYIDVAIRGLEQAVYSHQYYIDNEDVSEGSLIWHRRTIDKYKVAIIALDLIREKAGGG